MLAQNTMMAGGVPVRKKLGRHGALACSSALHCIVHAHSIGILNLSAVLLNKS